MLEIFYLEVSVGAVPKNTKAKKARNAKKVAVKVREEGLGRRIPGGSAESEARRINQMMPRRFTCRDISMSIRTREVFRYAKASGC